MSDEKQIVTIEAKSGSGKLRTVMTMTALIVMAGALAYGYSQVTHMSSTLTKTVAEMKQQASADQRTVQSLQESLSVLQKSALLAAERSDATKWNIAEAKYLTKQADYQLQLAHDVSSAIIFLQHAADIMQSTPGPALDSIRQALKQNISDLQEQPLVSTEDIFVKLSAINSELDNLPLPPTPLQYTEEANARQKDYSEAPWWKSQWHKTMDSLRKVVIVRYMGANDMPLIMPEEKMFLYQNLHAEMQAAILGVLNHHPAVYQTSLANMSAWIEKYFIHNAPLTIKLLGEIHDLQAVNLQSPNIDFASTLQLFDQYLASSMPAPVQPVVATPDTLGE